MWKPCDSFSYTLCLLQILSQMSEGARDPDILIGALIGPLVSFDTHSVRNLNLLPKTIHRFEKIEKLADLITY